MSVQTLPDTAVTTAAPRRPRTSRATRVDAGLLLAIAWLALLVLAAVAPAALTPVDPLAADPLALNRAPSAAHPFGTDYLGRDVLARVVHGARYSLTIGLLATALAVTGGVLLGLGAGVSGRFGDAVLSRIVDVLASFPAILLALVVIGFTGTGMTNLIIALGLATIPTYARLVRARTLQVVGSGYVEQARTFGLTRPALVGRHVLPNALGVVPVLATIELGHAIIAAAALSFLGMGPQPPTPEWGAMLADSRNYLRIAPWAGVLPGLVLTLTVIASTVVGRRWQAAHELRNR